MEATTADLEALRELQQVDIVLINTQKRIEGLPHRQQLQELAGKKQAVLEKQGQVSKMHDAAQRKVAQLEDEAAILETKRADTQKRIDEATGDFRAVQSLTRDLGGIAKRLEALEGEQLAASEKLEQVDGVLKQLGQAAEALDAQALQLRGAYQQQLGALQQELQQAQERHDAIASGVGEAVLREYLATARRCGGVGLAELADGKCSVCRNSLDPNRMLVVKREAPLASCPSCRRLLVVS